MIEFFGVFLITSNRRKEMDHPSPPHLQSASIVIHSPPPSIHEHPNHPIVSSTTPLLNPHYDDIEHQSTTTSATHGRRSSIIGGISLHSHLTTKEGDN